MAQGGIHDHLNGRFARYATDAHCRVPHFEKMLYDNAQLLERYAKAYLKDPDPLYKKTVEGIVEFCQRELQNPAGGFYPSLDDKILTSWNASMIKGLCWAYIAFEASRYLTLAQKTAEILETNLQKPRGGLYAVWARGTASIEGFASDYAFLGDALLDLHEVTGVARYLSWAEQLCSYLIENFSVPGKARFCFSTHPLIPGLGPRIEDTDSVLPSSNAVAADVLLRLGRVLHKNEYIDRSIALLHEGEAFETLAHHELRAYTH